MSSKYMVAIHDNVFSVDINDFTTNVTSACKQL